MTGFQIFLTNQLQIYKKTQVLCLQQLQQKSLSTWFYLVHTKIIPHHAQTTQKRGLDTKNTRHCRCCFPNGGTTWSTVADEIYRSKGAYSCSSNEPRWMQFDITDVLWLISVTGVIWPRSSNDMTYLCWLLCFHCWSRQTYFKFSFQAAGCLLERKAHEPPSGLLS